MRVMICLSETVLSSLRKSQAEVTKAIKETHNKIDVLEGKHRLTREEEQEYDRLCYKSDSLEEELDDIGEAITILSKYR